MIVFFSLLKGAHDSRGKGNRAPTDQDEYYGAGCVRNVAAAAVNETTKTHSEPRVLPTRRPTAFGYQGGAAINGYEGNGGWRDEQLPSDVDDSWEKYVNW